LAAAPTAIAGGAEAETTTTPPGTVGDRIVVGFGDEVPENVDEWIRELGGEIDIVNEQTGWIAAEFPEDSDADEALDKATQRSDVTYAEHDRRVEVLGVPNDPGYDDQWGFPAIDAPTAWNTTQADTDDVKVAVLDTGIQIEHEDLEKNACGPFTSMVPSEPTIRDGSGHGTHVAGTVSAVNDNGVGVAGTSEACIMGAKVLGSSGYGYFSWVANGVTWATDNGADVISMSLGGGYSSVMEDAVEYAFDENGVLVVSAAGNAGCFGGDSVGYPAAFDESMAVAALSEPGDDTAWFSSCGPQVDIAAPGAGVLSTLPECNGQGLCSNSGYGYLSGTSMATPHVSGVAALVQDENPEHDGLATRCHLYATADEMGNDGRDDETGFGRLDADQAVNLKTVDRDDATSGLNGPQIARECGELALPDRDDLPEPEEPSTVVPDLPAPN